MLQRLSRLHGKCVLGMVFSRAAAMVELLHRPVWHLQPVTPPAYLAKGQQKKLQRADCLFATERTPG
eukprot:6421706-Amphidinium_carterae.1